MLTLKTLTPNFFQRIWIYLIVRVKGQMCKKAMGGGGASQMTRDAPESPQWLKKP